MKKLACLLICFGFAATIVWPNTAKAVCFVREGATGKNDGTSWTNAYFTPQLALMLGCSEIWVAKGVYTPAGFGSSPAMSFEISPNAKMYGGFAGNESSLNQRNASKNLTVLSGDVDHNDNDPGDWMKRTADDIVGLNSYHIVVFNGTIKEPVLPTTVLDGFVVSGSNDTSDNDGGAIICLSECSPTLSNLRLTGNIGRSGGALSMPFGGNPVVVDDIFSGNLAIDVHGGNGGAIFVGAGPGTFKIARSTFINNKESGNGYGGAIFVETDTFLENLTFYGNQTFSFAGGGAFSAANVNVTILNSTFLENFASNFGGAIYNRSNTIIRNSIFWNNDAGAVDGGKDILAISNVGNSVIKSGCPAGSVCSGITTQDPKLSSLGNHGGSTTTLLPGFGGSAIDSGDDTTCAAIDQRGVIRPNGSHCDMGAVEWQPSDDVIFRDGFQRR